MQEVYRYARRPSAWETRQIPERHQVAKQSPESNERYRSPSKKSSLQKILRLPKSSPDEESAPALDSLCAAIVWLLLLQGHWQRQRERPSEIPGCQLG